MNTRRLGRHTARDHQAISKQCCVGLHNEEHSDVGRCSNAIVAEGNIGGNGEEARVWNDGRDEQILHKSRQAKGRLAQQGSIEQVHHSILIRIQVLLLFRQQSAQERAIRRQFGDDIERIQHIRAIKDEIAIRVSQRTTKWASGTRLSGERGAQSIVAALPAT